MLLRITMNDRQIPVNFPDGKYTDAAVEELTDQLLIRLADFTEAQDWHELLTIELEANAAEWMATLYFSKRMTCFRFR